jgi:hypothetical protein
MPCHCWTKNFVFLLVFLFSLSSGFQVSTRSRCLSSIQNSSLQSKLFGPGGEEYDDGIGEPSGQSNQDDGQALAKDFYDQLRKREEAKQRGGSISSEGSKISEQQNQQPVNVNDDTQESSFLNQQKGAARSDDEATPNVKFTGRRDAPNFYAATSRSPGGRSPRETMMEREFELVGRAEKNIVFQAVFAAVVLAFYIYIGATGGIVSGDVAASADFGGEDLIPFEQVMPLQNDQETSVWL